MGTEQAEHVLELVVFGLCLLRDQRIAYLLGDLLGFSDAEGAEICDVSRAAFRQRRARETTTIDQAARELDIAVAVAEVYRTDPSFAAPTAVWAGLVHAIPTLLRDP
jgi:hypothetical protein